MRRFLILFLLFCLPGGSLTHGQISDDTEKKRELFLKAREQMKVLPPEPTATPKPKPHATPRPHPKAESDDSASDESPTDTPAKPKSTPQPTDTPEPTAPPHHTPQPTSTPKATPAPKPTSAPDQRNVPSAPITVQKSGGKTEADLIPAPSFGWFGPQWKYLSKSVRNAIDRAPVARGRWKYIVVHNSGTRQGNARIFDYYHRHTRHMPNGLAYHFVIGNGSSSGDGEIEIGNRWTRQLNGGHVHSDYLNYISLGICLVGDFNRDKPDQKQLEALDELIRYLRSRCGKVEHRYAIVRAHKEINPVPTDCPGDRFPIAWLHRRFD